MNEQIAPSDYRYLIRATLTGTGDPNSLQNMNTVPLPNGAMCFVISAAALYSLDKNATTGGITPSSGPGQWRLFAVGQSESGVAMIVSSGFNSFTVDGNWGQTTSANTVADTVTDPTWALTPTGSVLTYTGSPGKFLVTLVASARVGDAGAPRDVFLGVSHNSDLTGAPTAGTSGEVDEVITAATADRCISTSRVVSMATGDTLRPKMAGPAGATSLAAMLRMTVAPA